MKWMKREERIEPDACHGEVNEDPSSRTGPTPPRRCAKACPRRTRNPTPPARSTSIPCARGKAIMIPTSARHRPACLRPRSTYDLTSRARSKASSSASRLQAMCSSHCSAYGVAIIQSGGLNPRFRASPRQTALSSIANWSDQRPRLGSARRAGSPCCWAAAVVVPSGVAGAGAC